ncbi:MAG TPA: class I SAM-dependent methyltransferase [Halothiobacillaceae bacterium]|nr:class I SAM-dependent methyltransferase [Halothiobacillaceae bacterium]
MPQNHNLRADIQFPAQLCDQHLVFNTTWGLFSPREIDEGTELLLRYLPEFKPGERIIDLGCGYGPIGVSLAAANPQSEIIMLDKDFVAVDYANKNAQQNRLNNARAILSNGLSAVNGETFDAVISNVPAKVGKEMWSIMLEDAYRGLKPGGSVWFVSINGLRAYFKRTMQQQFGNYKKVKQSRNYVIHRAVKGNQVRS